MSTTTTIVVLGIVILAVIVIALVMASRSDRMRRPALKTLSPESRDRYVTQWDKVESRFVDSPEDAVKEADALLLALLGEREHPLAEEKLPDNMLRARREAMGKEGKGGTEGMRLALLHYRTVIEEYAGPEARADTQGRREIAS
jgi:hypothetical protein